MAGFEYTDQVVARLVVSMSEDRLRPYLLQSKGDHAKAIKLYERNIAVSEGFYSIIHILEIALRNRLDTILSARIASHWFNKAGLSEFSMKNVEKARSTIARRGK